MLRGNKGEESETIIGKRLKRSGNREKVTIATKVGKEMGSGLSKKYMRQAVDKVAQEHNMTPAQFAPSWLIAHPGITTPIDSASDFQQLSELIKATTTELNPSLIDFLNQTSEFNKTGPLQ